MEKSHERTLLLSVNIRLLPRTHCLGRRDVRLGGKGGGGGMGGRGSIVTQYWILGGKTLFLY